MLVAVAGFAGVPFPGGFVVARAEPGPGGQVRGVGEELPDIGADLGDDRGGGQRADAGDGRQQLPLGAKGAIIVSICASSFAIIASRWPMWSRCRRHIRA